MHLPEGVELYYVGLQPLSPTVAGGLRLSEGGELYYIRLQPSSPTVAGLRLPKGGELSAPLENEERLGGRASAGLPLGRLELHLAVDAVEGL